MLFGLPPPWRDDGGVGGGNTDGYDAMRRVCIARERARGPLLVVVVPIWAGPNTNQPFSDIERESEPVDAAISLAVPSSSSSPVGPAQYRSIVTERLCLDLWFPISFSIVTER